MESLTPHAAFSLPNRIEKYVGNISRANQSNNEFAVQIQWIVSLHCLMLTNEKTNHPRVACHAERSVCDKSRYKAGFKLGLTSDQNLI